MKYIINHLLSLLAVTTIVACSDNLLETLPNDRVSSEIYWQTENDFTLGANAVYTLLEGAGDFTNWDAMSDIGHVTLMWREESIIEKGAYDATIGKVLRTWTDAYTGIQAANIFLDKAKESEGLNQDLINRLMGEVKVLRAFFYTRLAILYGDVPLLKKETTLEEARALTRTPVSEVWDFVYSELNEAADLLPTVQQEKGRMTKGAALALQARAMLYAHRYQEAATAAKKVMDLNVYRLYPRYEKLFSYEAENNEEVIMSREYIKNIQSNNIFSLTTPNSLFPQVNSFVPTKQAVDAYQMSNGKDIADPTSGFDPRNPYKNRDPRLKYSIFVLGDMLFNGQIYDPRPGSGTGDAIGYAENSTATGFNVKKYLNAEDMAQPSNCGINLIFIRYAEVLLSYAEAKIELNQIDESVLAAINEVRARPDVNMPPIQNVSGQSELREVVRRERLVEFAFEGLRYFDLRRWRTAEEVIPGIIYGMTYVDASGNLQTISLPGFLKVFNPQRDYLWPVPQREIELNPNLSQNPNW
ncbi:MAG TPA: RagB/SusD family nutrient uptake outer membrane protein [Cyclobacteriaceae bacterium]|nr:RagB/SusD family nutrient uptake outer membrane protein [Cyclobacteriaceae bacterium]